MGEGPAEGAVIGAGGFIGSRLADQLEVAGVRTARFTRSTPLLRAGRPAPALRSAQVIHYLATSINPAVAERHPELVAADHAGFTGLLAALEETGHRPALVLTSTAGAVYDPGVPPPYGEDDPLGPATAYGRAKLAMERALFEAGDVVRPVVLRIANAYGPGQRTGTGQGVIGHWLEAAAAGTPLRVFGDTAARRDYVYVADVVHALLRAHHLAEQSREPLVANIASGRPVSLGELLRLVRETVGHDVHVERHPARGFDRRDVWFDVDRAARGLNWWPRTSLQDGVQRTWRALRPSVARL